MIGQRIMALFAILCGFLLSPSEAALGMQSRSRQNGMKIRALYLPKGLQKRDGFAAYWVYPADLVQTLDIGIYRSAEANVYAGVFKVGDQAKLIVPINASQRGVIRRVGIMAQLLGADATRKLVPKSTERRDKGSETEKASGSHPMKLRIFSEIRDVFDEGKGRFTVLGHDTFGHGTLYLNRSLDQYKTQHQIGHWFASILELLAGKSDLR